MKLRRFLIPFLILALFVVVNVSIVYFHRPSMISSRGVKMERQRPGPAEKNPLEEEAAVYVKQEDDDAAHPKELFYQYDPKSWNFASLEELLRQKTPKKYWGASTEPYDRLKVLQDHTGCNIIDVPFRPQQDEKCIQYMINTENWISLRALPQEFDSRTIKFEVLFKPIAVSEGERKALTEKYLSKNKKRNSEAAGDENEDNNETFDEFFILQLRSMMKVPQKLFRTEAFSEVASYHADRILRIHRIPPTGWVCIPLRFIHQCVESQGETVKTVEEFLKDSGVKDYAEWIQKDLIGFARGHSLIRKSKGTEEECIGASIQVRVMDAAHLLDSALKIPYIPHNASWMQMYDWTTSRRPTFLQEPYLPSLIHLSEIATFDYIIGNGDRSPNKNNFVVGGCKRRCSNNLDDYFKFSAEATEEMNLVVKKKQENKKKHKGKKMRHPGVPNFVHLDQGMGFYGVEPRNNPIANSIKREKKGDHQKNTYCLFRAPLLNRIRYLSAPSAKKSGRSKFHQLLREKAPADVQKLLSGDNLQQCTKRMFHILRVVDQCLAEPDFAPWVLTP